MSAVVRTATDGGVVRIVLARPEAGNAVTPALIAALADAVALAERPETGAVLIEGEGRNFCVGADLRHFQRSTEPLPRQLDAMAVDFHAMLLRLASLPVPVVAAVQGHAVGGGLGLLLAADVVVAGQSARFSTGYAKLGLSADAGVSYFLTRTLGPRRARSLLMTARTIDAAHAKRWGLVDTLVDDDALAGAALDTARARSPPGRPPRSVR